jgi:hypothetical protein
MTFTTSGSFIRQQAIEGSTEDVALRAWGVLADCRTMLLAAERYRLPAAGQVDNTPVTLMWQSSEHARRDTIGTFPTLEVVAINHAGEMIREVLPWGAQAIWTLHNNRFYIGDSMTPEIRVFEPGKGAVQIIRWSAESRAITAADRDRYEEVNRRGLQKYPASIESFPPLSIYPEMGQYKPLYRTMIVDDEENVWLRPYNSALAGRPRMTDFAMLMWERPDSTDASEPWLVFDRTGKLRALAQVPPDLEVKVVSKELIVVWRDELDVEHVKAYPLLKQQ